MRGIHTHILFVLSHSHAHTLIRKLTHAPPLLACPLPKYITMIPS
jgi:hypothetical protein